MADPGLQFLFLQIEYLAIPWIPGLVIRYSLELGKYEKYCRYKYLLAIFFIPAIIFISFFTDPYFHLYYRDITFAVIDNLTVMSAVPGTMYMVMIAAQIISLIFCFIIISRLFYQAPRIFRPQMFLTLFALILILGGLGIYISLPRPYPNFDI